MNYEQGLRQCYKNTLFEIEKTDRAKKDIVGESYENFRKLWILSLGLDVATTEEKKRFNKALGGLYNADQYIVDPQSRNLLALEEDKGHYVDKCFAGRFLHNVATVINHCKANNIQVPYFILSCPTNYKFDELVGSHVNMYREDIAQVIDSKVLFFHSCDHGRTDRKKYLREKKMPFMVELENVEKEKSFLISLKEG